MWSVTVISTTNHDSRWDAGGLADEEGVQSQLLEESDVPLQVTQPLINQRIRELRAMKTIHDAFDDELSDFVRGMKRLLTMI